MSFTLPVLTAFTISWTLTDQNGNPINNATVTATLYSGRSRTSPNDVPGTAVPPIIALALPYVAASTGVYQGVVPPTLNPEPNGAGFVLVIDATVLGNQVFHAEEPATVETSGSKLDLSSVDQYKAWAPGLQPGVPTDDDPLIQSCLTAWSYTFLRLTGTGAMNGDFTQSPFTAICEWVESYDGANTQRLFVRNRPIRVVNSLTINGINIIASPSTNVQGYVVDGSGKSIALRGSGGPGAGYAPYTTNAWQAGAFRVLGGGPRFWKGIQNIVVDYTAGYAITPADITQCANQIVLLNYKRRNWIGELSRSVAGGGGSITFGNWVIPPECQVVVDSYARTL